MESTKVLLGGRIKELRKKRGLSQDQLAEKIGIDPKHLSRIEVGRGYPSLDTLERMAEVLGFEMKNFFEFNHLKNADEVKIAAVSMIDSATEEDLRKIVRVLSALLK